MLVEKAPDIDKIVKSVLKRNLFPYIDASRIVCMRSTKATSRARARIWSFPHIWQLALNKPAHYIIEILSQHFDHLPDNDKIRVIIHELMHIPKNFSGALVPHRGIHKRIDGRTVEKIFQMFKNYTK
ncbi:metallopeptidase [Patescibacteria group bacterium]|nr:metallopeptidase [Patescibacteria group bacterium]